MIETSNQHANSINAIPQVAKAPATCVIQLYTCTQKWRQSSQGGFPKAAVDLEPVPEFR